MNEAADPAASRSRRRRSFSLLAGSLLFTSPVACSIYDQALLEAGVSDTSGLTDRPFSSSTGGAAMEPPSMSVAGQTSMNLGGSTPAGGSPSTGGSTDPSGGMGGTSEEPDPETCVDYPLPSRALWKVSASHEDEDPERAIDQNAATRWSTAGSMSGDEWITIDFGVEVMLSTLNVRHDGTDYARGFEVVLGVDEPSLDAPPQLSGSNNETELSLEWGEPQLGRYLTLRQTGTSGSWWSIVELDFSCVDP